MSWVSTNGVKHVRERGKLRAKLWCGLREHATGIAALGGEFTTVVRSCGTAKPMTVGACDLVNHPVCRSVQLTSTEGFIREGSGTSRIDDLRVAPWR
jgi:hypothetical protein